MPGLRVECSLGLQPSCQAAHSTIQQPGLATPFTLGHTKPTGQTWTQDNRATGKCCPPGDTHQGHAGVYSPWLPHLALAQP